MLHNPRYAGAFVFGRNSSRLGPQGRRIHTKVHQDEWPFLIRDAHPGYISWERFEANAAQLRLNAQAYGHDRRSAPREGPALIQGIVLCGHCGRGMTVRYSQRNDHQTPIYNCQSEGIESSAKKCQSVPGGGIDRVIGELLIELMTPASFDMTLKVHDELVRRAEEADALRARKVQRAGEEAELARQRFMQAHPDNRLVADVLEAEWDKALRNHQAMKTEYEKQQTLDDGQLCESQRQKIMSLAVDFARLWHDSETPQRERKRMVRLLIEDVTISSDDENGTVTLGIRLSGGAARTLNISRELPAFEKYRTDKAVVEHIDALIENHTDRQIAEILNERGCLSGRGLNFNAKRVAGIRTRYHLKSRYQRLRDKNLLTLKETAEVLGITTNAVKYRRRTGTICGYPYNDSGECLYELPPAADKTDCNVQADKPIQ